MPRIRRGIRADGFLQPAKAEITRRLDETQRLAQRPGLVGIRHQPLAFAQIGAKHAQIRHVAHRIEPDLDLEGANARLPRRRDCIGCRRNMQPAGIDRHRLGRAARRQHLGKRHARAPCQQIVRGNVEPCNDLPERPPFTALQRAHMGFPRQPGP